MKKRILIIEDQVDDYNGIKKLINDDDEYYIYEIPNFVEFEEKLSQVFLDNSDLTLSAIDYFRDILKKFNPDFIILDWELKKGGRNEKGKKFYNLVIKEDNLLNKIPIIIFSGANDTEKNSALEFQTNRREENKKIEFIIKAGKLSVWSKNPVIKTQFKMYLESKEETMDKTKKIRIGILSVIAVENNALKKVFGINDDDEILEDTGDIKVYKGHSIFFKKTSVKDVEIELCFSCLNKAGNLNSATKTKTFIERCNPDMMILFGIGGAIKTKKSRIGNVFYSRSITSVSKKIIKEDETLEVPRVIDLPHQILNMFNNQEFNIDDYHSRISDVFGEEFILDVEDSFVVKDMKPQVDDCSFNSEDSLFKKLIDSVSNINPESKLTEMEAAGFVEACTDEDNSHKPWLVIRVISDFGDGKSDNYQKMVSSFGAVYVKYFIENILRPNSL